MTVSSPTAPKIYHIVHLDRLASIVADGFLWCDAKLQKHPQSQATIGMTAIKQRRLINPVKCPPGLNVGDCVPFYFCARSVMLFLIYKANHSELNYRGGQEPVVHLEADLREVVDWAEQNQRRWAFTLSNAGSSYFKDRCDLAQLYEIDWNAIKARDWRDPGTREGKQAEFLVEGSFSWMLVRRIGVRTLKTHDLVAATIRSAAHRPTIAIRRDWYY